VIEQPWTVLTVAAVIDGDSCKLIRQRTLGITDGLRIDATDTKPVNVRLGWLDTPERGQSGYALARIHLHEWLAAYMPDVTAIPLGRESFGRHLMDLRNADGQSCSQWMITDRGWLPYVEGK
jgi:endonuclease YncB( thermonuclease family)